MKPTSCKYWTIHDHIKNKEINDKQMNLLCIFGILHFEWKNTFWHKNCHFKVNSNYRLFITKYRSIKIDQNLFICFPSILWVSYFYYGENEWRSFCFVKEFAPDLRRQNCVIKNGSLFCTIIYYWSTVKSKLFHVYRNILKILWEITTTK